MSGSVHVGKLIATLENVPKALPRPGWLICAWIAVACNLNPQPDLPVSTNDRAGAGAPPAASSGGGINLGASGGAAAIGGGAGGSPPPTGPKNEGGAGEGGDHGGDGGGAG